MAVFTAITQGILVAGLSTYVDQIKKQMTQRRMRLGRQISRPFCGRGAHCEMHYCGYSCWVTDYDCP